jgi:cell division protein ZapA (FtsZ GTPase activity inhibitor)
MTTKEIEVQFLGKNFSFNVPKDISTEDFLEIIDFVESRFGKIRKETGDLDSFRLGLLAAINITEEFFYLKKENDKLRAVLANIDSMLPPVDQENPSSIRFSS